MLGSEYVRIQILPKYVKFDDILQQTTKLAMVLRLFTVSGM